VGRRPVIDWQSLEPLSIANWCEGRRKQLIDEAKRLPLWAVKHSRALESLHEKRMEIGRRQLDLEAARQAIRERWVAGQLDEIAANAALAQLRPAINKTYADFKKLRQQYRRTTEKILRGRGKERHRPTISFGPKRPWGMENQILTEASAHFSREWCRPISERTVRSAWDDLRSILHQLGE
jgi:hypothetical protein